MADKALILGVNTYKNVNPLRGCVADTETMRGLLVDVFKFPSKNIRTLTNEQVVKLDVLKQLDWLFQGAKPGDRAVLHFSGHGSYVDDKNGDEPDGRDELLALYDMDFSDPGTYLLDDELKEWTKKKPAGVALTVVLDNCNSGTGTRMLMAAEPGEDRRQTEVDPETTLKRSMSNLSGARGLDASRAATRAIRPDNPDMIRVRFIEPPPAVKARVERASSRAATTRGFVKVKDLNHVLLAACRDDQTAADATIDGKPCGAFTYYLDQTIREGGENVRRKLLIGKVEAALREGHFIQSPQLEGPGDGLLFTMPDSPHEPEVDEMPPTAKPRREASSSDEDTFLELVDKLAPLDPESRSRVLDLYEGLHSGAHDAGRGIRSANLTGLRVLVPVHGICQHPAGFSNEWWTALRPFTSEFGAGKLGETRREVLWSDLVNERGLRTRELDEEQTRLAEQIRETLRDRIDRHTIESGPRSGPDETPRAMEDSRALISIPGLNCLDDFVVYMTDDAVRASILKRFTDVVRPLLEEGAEIDVLSHSWGTVVAYEGLRELADDDGLTSPRIRNFFTVGAALSIGAVKSALRPANRDGRRPAMVRRWVNLDASGDPVGGPLQGRPYAVDFDFPNLDAFSCAKVFGVVVNPSCAHGSYFKNGNAAVNRDIFAKFINRH